MLTRSCAVQAPEPSSGPPALAVRRLVLGHFRNHAETRLVLDPAPVVLTGANGSGKTSLLEAISLLVPGRGLRRAHAAEWQSRAAPEPWAVAADIATPDGLVRLGTGRDPETPDQERRVVHVDGKTARNQQALADIMALSWITPEMDRVLVESPSSRRRLLDRLVYSFDPAHAGRVQRYEKALRERLRLLREGRMDAAWLAALEDAMAQAGVAIAAARRQMTRQLQGAMRETSGAFPRARIALRGVVEELLDAQPALLVEDRFREALARQRREDADSGLCATGPHRSDLEVVHEAQACPAELCSTGEQKALLIAIMLAHARILAVAREVAPILLLDDIAAHLDSLRRAALFGELRALGIQAWLTGTDRESFATLLPFAQALQVEGGRVESG